MSLLRAWFLATGALLGGLFLYVYVPVVIPVLAVAAGLGALTIAIVQGARWLERWLGRGRRD